MSVCVSVESATARHCHSRPRPVKSKYRQQRRRWRSAAAYGPAPRSPARATPALARPLPSLRAAMPDDPLQPPAPPRRRADRGRPPAPLAGTVAVPGDKSISHRALMFGALAVGRTEITGPARRRGRAGDRGGAARDGRRRSSARRTGAGWSTGSASAASASRRTCIDLGNSGTAARLLLGILATHPFTAFVTGDASLRRRPMGRVIEPLSRFGAQFRQPRGRPAAAGGDRRRRPGADRVPPAGAVGAGQVGGAARRAQHARRHHA